MWKYTKQAALATLSFIASPWAGCAKQSTIVPGAVVQFFPNTKNIPYMLSLTAHHGSQNCRLIDFVKTETRLDGNPDDEIVNKEVQQSLANAAYDIGADFVYRLSVLKSPYRDSVVSAIDHTTAYATGLAFACERSQRPVQPREPWSLPLLVGDKPTRALSVFFDAIMPIGDPLPKLPLSVKLVLSAGVLDDFKIPANRDMLQGASFLNWRMVVSGIFHHSFKKSINQYSDSDDIFIEITRTDLSGAPARSFTRPVGDEDNITYSLAWAMTMSLMYDVIFRSADNSILCRQTGVARSVYEQVVTDPGGAESNWEWNRASAAMDALGEMNQQLVAGCLQTVWSKRKAVMNWSR